jgi:predicted NAD/FAD-binding protein
VGVRVAVIGGGASGLVTAHLLSGVHRVTLIERESVLGGNIRTLNRNVSCPAVASDLHLDAGVIEFERDLFPAFHALMADLEVDLGEVAGSSGLYLADGRSFQNPGSVGRAHPGWVDKTRAFVRLAPVGWSRRRFLRRAAAATPAELVASPLSRYLDDSVFSLWARLLIMYAYSLPIAAVGDAPAALAVPTLCDMIVAGRWSRVVGGVYTYVERILERFDGEVLLATRVSSVRRDGDGVDLEMAGGETRRFEAVVFATTPDQVLAILADASDAEIRRFHAWEPQQATVVIHTDDGLYRRRGVRCPSEFDLIETATGAHGYNAYLNRLTGLGEEGVARYQLAFNLDEEIDPDLVVHRQQHTTPRYTVEAFRHRDEVVATNGENHTFHVGAYLGDGLHEGAVRSASAASRLLGGREIRF